MQKWGTPRVKMSIQHQTNDNKLEYKLMLQNEVDSYCDIARIFSIPYRSNYLSL